MDQAQGLRRRRILVDVRDKTGSRIRLWDVRGKLSDSARDGIARELLRRFPEVQWVSKPCAGCVWLLDETARSAIDGLPSQVMGWESAPVGVWVWTREPGWAAQGRVAALFRGFSALRYLGTVHVDPRKLPKRAQFLVKLKSLGLKTGLESFRKEVALFVKLWSDWNQELWGTALVNRFQDEPARLGAKERGNA